MHGRLRGLLAKRGATKLHFSSATSAGYGLRVSMLLRKRNASRWHNTRLARGVTCSPADFFGCCLALPTVGGDSGTQIITAAAQRLRRLGHFFNSSRNSGEGGADFEEKVFLIAIAAGVSLDDLASVVDALEDAGVERVSAARRDPVPVGGRPIVGRRSVRRQCRSVAYGRTTARRLSLPGQAAGKITVA